MLTRARKADPTLAGEEGSIVRKGREGKGVGEEGRGKKSNVCEYGKKRRKRRGDER